MLTIPNGLNNIRRRSCELDVLQRENAMQVERIRSKNQTDEQQNQQQRRFSTLNLAKKLSNRLSILTTANDLKSNSQNGSNNNQEQIISPKESIYTINVQLKPNKGQYIYRPGQSVQGTFTVKGQANKLASFKRITIRVHGMMIFSRFEKDETKRAGRSIGRKKWLFYDSKPMCYTKEELKNLGIDSRPIAGDITQQQMLEMPFAFELPVRCISYQHAFRFVREPAPLPPTMHFEVQEDKDNEMDDGTEFGSNEKNRRSSSFKRTWNTLKGKLAGNCTLEATVQYMLTVTVEWQENFLRYHIAKCNLPFIVQPSPPTSTTFIHTITNSHSRQLLHLPEQRTSTEFSGNVFHETGENIMTNDVGDLLNMSRGRRPSLTVDRQISNDSSSTDNLSTWVDLMLKETERGPQAWVFYHLYKRIATDQLIEVILSHPATAAMVMDTPIPFTVTVSDAIYVIQPGSISFNLLRAIKSVSPGGELKLEKRIAQKRCREGSESVVGLSDVKPMLRTTSTPPPADEYSRQDFLACPTSQNGFEGKLIIDSGFEANQEALFESKSVSVNAEKEQDSQESKVHPCFLRMNKDQILIPSFNFRGLCVEYNLEVNLILIKRRSNQDEDLMHISFQTPMIKVASRNQRIPNPPIPGPRRRTRSALDFATIPSRDALTEVDTERRLPTRHSSLILESLIMRQTPQQLQRPPEWNRNGTLPPLPTPSIPEGEAFIQFPQRPPFRRTNQSDEITPELIRTSNASAASRRTSNDEGNAEYAEISSIPSNTAGATSSSSESNSSCLESGPEASVNDFASCLETDTFASSSNPEARQPMLQIPSFDSTNRAASPLLNEDLSEVIDNIEQVTTLEYTSYGHSAYLEGIPNSINPRMSLISMRTIDGPAPPYIGTLQDS